MYFTWTVSDDYPDSLWLQYDFDSSPDPDMFKTGRRVRRVKSPLTFKVQAKNSATRLSKYDYLMSDATELVSQRFATLIEKIAPGDCQFFPADVSAGGIDVEGYAVVNVSVRLPCIDMKKSKYKPMVRGEAGPPFEFSKYVLVPGCLGKHHVARADEEEETIIVDEAFANACRNAKIRGVDFEPIG